VALIVTPGPLATLAAKAATTTIPILFGAGADPVRLGLVASLNQPGGNLTGFSQFNAELGAKALALLHDLVPSTATIGFLQNPDNPIIDELLTRNVLAAALPTTGSRTNYLLVALVGSAVVAAGVLFLVLARSRRRTPAESSE